MIFSVALSDSAWIALASAYYQITHDTEQFIDYMSVFRAIVMLISQESSNNDNYA
jgi:hypothetical protein